MIVPGKDRFSNKILPLRIIIDLPLTTPVELHGLIILVVEQIPDHQVLPLIQEVVLLEAPIVLRVAVVQEAGAVREVADLPLPVHHHQVPDLHAVTTKQGTTIA